jgi:hypothetical protein
LKVALVYPTVAALVEKMAAIFPGLTVIGPPCDDLHKWPKEILPLAKANDRLKEWQEVGLDIQFEEKPYSECDFSKFDLLIESVETFNYAADWRNHCTRVECPIIVFVCWFDSPAYVPSDYLQYIHNFPVLLGMPSGFAAWSAALPDVRVFQLPVGDWWFEREWTGEKEQALFVLAGKDLWRPSDKSICGVDLVEKLCGIFPGKIHHHDGANEFKTARQMAEMFSRYRVFVNLDNQGARPLCTSFTEALAAGMPVLARDLPGLNYREFIGGNGLATDNFSEMCEFLDRLFVDLLYAKKLSARSRDIGRASFSVEAVRASYQFAAERAKEVFRSRSWR